MVTDDVQGYDGHRKAGLRHELSHADDGVEGDLMSERKVLDRVAVLGLFHVSLPTAILCGLLIHCLRVRGRVHGWFELAMVRDDVGSMKGGLQPNRHRFINACLSSYQGRCCVARRTEIFREWYF